MTLQTLWMRAVFAPVALGHSKMLTVVVSNSDPPSGGTLMPKAVLDERQAVVRALLARRTLTDDQRRWLERLGHLITDDQACRRRQEVTKARRIETRIRWHDNGHPA